MHIYTFYGNLYLTRMNLSGCFLGNACRPYLNNNGCTLKSPHTEQCSLATILDVILFIDIVVQGYSQDRLYEALMD